MTLFVAALISGISLGVTLALISLGMVLAYRATHTFNFAHGQFMLIPALVVGSWLPMKGLHLALSVVVGLAAVGIGAAAFYLFVVRYTSGFMSTITTLGLAGALNGVIQLGWAGKQYQITLPGMPTGSVSIVGAKIATADLVRTAGTVVIVLIVTIVLRYTTAGRQIRLAGQDPILASQSGVNVRTVHLASWAIAAVLAGIAGIAYGSTTLVDPTFTNVALAAAPAIVLGGLDSIPGSIVGGVVIGLVQSFVVIYGSPSAQNVAIYGLLLATMLVVPHGIFGTRTVARV